eukprot:1832846-Rhodomonas_salina.2
MQPSPAQHATPAPDIAAAVRGKPVLDGAHHRLRRTQHTSLPSHHRLRPTRPRSLIRWRGHCSRSLTLSHALARCTKPKRVALTPKP